MHRPVDAELLEQIKQILRRDLKLGAEANIRDDMPLIGGDMDLDSLDILLMVSSLEKHFKIKIPNEAVGRAAFADVVTLARFVQDNRAALAAAATAPSSAPVTVVQPSASTDWLNALPHGPEFRFISRVDEVVPGQRAAGAWIVDGSEAFFRGHFPGRPIVPGVLLIESMAQLAGIAAADPSAPGGGGGVLAHADVHFESPVQPPAEIALSATVRSPHTELARTCDVTATVAGRTVARGNVTIRFQSAKG
jgi:3-hydroxyacyl-[acyl-carrier-protein] dehydratase